MKILFGFLILSLPSLTNALALTEETDFGKDELVQTLGADGEFGATQPEDDPLYNWQLGYSFQRTTTSDQGTSVVDKTQSASAGLGWTPPNEFNMSGKISYANTPEEHLTAFGGQISGGYRFVYGHAHSGKFAPYLIPSLMASTLQYTETYNGTTTRLKKKIIKAVSNQASLRQNSIGLSLGWKPVRRWRFGLGYTKYIYNHDVTAFQNRLDSPAALQRGLAGLSNTTGSVASFTVTGQINWKISENWRFSASEQYAILAADHSVSTTTRTTISDQLTEVWELTLGAQRLVSNVLTDTMGIAGLECEF